MRGTSPLVTEQMRLARSPTLSVRSGLVGLSLGGTVEQGTRHGLMADIKSRNHTLLMTDELSLKVDDIVQCVDDSFRPSGK